MFEASPTPTEYEPYTEDFTGKKVTVHGANLFDVNGEVSRTEGEVYVSDGRIKDDSGSGFDFLWYEKKYPAGAYSLNFDMVDNSQPSHPQHNQRRCLFSNWVAVQNGSYIGNFADFGGHMYLLSNEGLTFTASEPFRIGFCLSQQEGASAEYYDIQLQFGYEPTQFFPFYNKEYTANTNGEVNGIKSLSPDMTFVVDADISVTYHKSYGMQTETDRFWDEYQQRGTRTNYDGAFCGTGWSNNNIIPKYDIRPTQAMWFMRYSTFSGDLVKHLEEIGVSLDFKDCVYFNEAFANAYYITRVGVIDLRKCTSEWNTTDMFTSAKSLVTIDKVIADGGTAINPNAFRRLSALKNITFEGEIVSSGLKFGESTLLTHDSLMSIINALKDYSGDTSGTSWVVTLGATNLAKLTDGEKSIATEKGWSLA
jgi:hypothetical protein